MTVHFLLNTSVQLMILIEVITRLFFFFPSCSSSSSDFAMHRFDRDSEVYKMIQENKESRTAPRQSNTFKMLQEVLEADERGWKLTVTKENLKTESCSSHCSTNINSVIHLFSHFYVVITLVCPHSHTPVWKLNGIRMCLHVGANSLQFF